MERPYYMDYSSLRLFVHKIVTSKASKHCALFIAEMSEMISLKRRLTATELFSKTRESGTRNSVHSVYLGFVKSIDPTANYPSQIILR